MNRKVLIGVLTFSIVLPFFAFKQTASAACGNSFYVGTNAEVVNGCTGLSEGQHIEGFSIDIENNKITLNNYNGGAIHYFCRATCADVKSMEIELIGNNTINSQSSDAYLKEHDVPQNAAFINIIPTFTGNGTLKIEAGQPIAFEGNRNSENFSVDIIGSNFKKNTAESQSQEIGPATSTVDASDKEEEKEQSPQSFFETALGIALLIAVPSVLIITIVILLVALLNKNKNNSLIETSNKPDNNQQF